MSTATRITIEQYEAMIDRGEFEPREEHHVELIRGEIVPTNPEGPMSPSKAPHASAIDFLNDWSFEVLPRRFAWVRVQNSLGIPALESVPEPDLAWLARKNYAKTHPTAEDVLLLIEVSDTSLRKDRGIKASLYAEAGIRDYWIVNISGRCVEVRRDPVGTSYREVTTYNLAATLSPLSLPGAVLFVDHLFPKDE